MGRVASTPTVTLTDPVFPALSVAVPDTTRLETSPGTVRGAGQARIPESASTQVNVTVIGWFDQPPTLSAGETVAVMVGGVGSIETCREPAAQFPAGSQDTPEL